MARKALSIVVVIGALGFLIGSIIENELFYTLTMCIAVCAGLVIAIQGRKGQHTK